MLTVAESAPAPEGENVNWIAHDDPGSRLCPPQPSVDVAKLLGFAPPMVTLPTLSAAEPLSVTVTVVGPLVVLACWLPKLTPPGLGEAPGAVIAMVS